MIQQQPKIARRFGAALSHVVILGDWLWLWQHRKLVSQCVSSRY
jgi:hypothetical protein